MNTFFSTRLIKMRVVFKFAFTFVFFAAESQSYTEAINFSTVTSDSTVGTNSSLLRANMQSDPSFQRCFASSCTVSSSSPIAGAER